jgi:hypothetical protein
MATQGRPERHDADYFKFYVKDGKTLFVLQHKYGLEGIGFFTNLMRLLTSTPNHYICIQDPGDALYVFSRIGVDEEKGKAMLEDMVLTGKLHKGLWKKHKVIVSPDLLCSLEILYEKRINDIITIEDIEEMFSDTGKSVEGDFPGTEKQSEHGFGEISGCDNTHTTLHYTTEEYTTLEKSTDARAPTREEARTPAPSDKLFTSIRNTFQSKVPVFTDPEKEIRAIWDICRLVRARSPDNPEAYAQSLVELYYWLTENGDPKYFGSMPFIPSRMKAVFDDVVKELENRSKEQEEAAIFDDEYAEEDIDFS